MDSKALERMLPGRVHQGVAARTTGAELLEISQVLDLLPPPPAPALVVVLDHLEDPHNAGAILRTAEGNKQYAVRIKDLVKRGDVAANVEMRPGDILIIPQSLF